MVGSSQISISTRSVSSGPVAMKVSADGIIGYILLAAMHDVRRIQNALNPALTVPSRFPSLVPDDTSLHACYAHSAVYPAILHAARCDCD